MPHSWVASPPVRGTNCCTEITVKNNLTNFNGTSIHWHGIRQHNTNWMDGVAGVTECPIPVRGTNINLAGANERSPAKSLRMSGGLPSTARPGTTVSP